MARVVHNNEAHPNCAFAGGMVLWIATKGETRLASRTIHAVGGIAVRNGARPRVAVVQRSKDKLWVLPRGKLRRDEHAVRGARREVVEETGFRVEVREFLGVITCQARSRPKVVRFWLM